MKSRARGTRVRVVTSGAGLRSRASSTWAVPSAFAIGRIANGDADLCREHFPPTLNVAGGQPLRKHAGRIRNRPQFGNRNVERSRQVDIREFRATSVPRESDPASADSESNAKPMPASTQAALRRSLEFQRDRQLLESAPRRCSISKRVPDASSADERVFRRLFEPDRRKFREFVSGWEREHQPVDVESDEPRIGKFSLTFHERDVGRAGAQPNLRILHRSAHDAQLEFRMCLSELRNDLGHRGFATVRVHETAI